MRKIDVMDNTLSVMSKEKKTLAFREKLLIAENLERIGVNAIDLSSIHSEKEDKIIYRTISENVDTMLSIPAGVSAESIAYAYECIKGAKRRRLQIVVPVSTVQMEYIYHVKAQKMLEKITALVSEAAKYDAEVELVAQDATRAEEGFLEACAKTAFENGATMMTVCDDNGDCFPEELAAIVKKIKIACDIKIYVQPSNKLQLAPAIFIECVKAGADGVKTAFGSNTLNVETVAEIMRAKAADLQAETDLDVTLVHKTAQAIREIAQHGATNASEEIKVKSKVSLDANATLKDVTDAVSSLGYELSPTDMGNVYEEFKRVTSKKEEVDERELEAIVAVTAMQVPSTYHLNTYVVNSGNCMTATANVTLERDGQALSGVSVGDGPIDAAFHAIEQIIGHHYELDDFNVQAVTKGREAVGSAIIRLRADGKLYSGNGVSTDIVGACIRAYINALNKIVYEEQKGE